jgi:three-Cys-motif partner protein
LQKYVDISHGVRKRFIGRGGATYIDLFSGPGRVLIEGQAFSRAGSPLVAWNQSRKSGSPFTRVYLGDMKKDLVDAAAARLSDSGASVISEVGPATETVDRLTSRLEPYGLHLAFLDPYSLGALSFEVIRKLAAFKHMDILCHISVMDMQRNLGKYIGPGRTELDDFAPGWRERVDTRGAPYRVRSEILAHWRQKIAELGMSTAETHEKVTGPKNQPLYWLAFAARHERALEFWEKIRNVSGQGQLF